MSIWPALIAYAIVFLCSSLLSRYLGTPSTSGRFASIDGLRGYLACGVFISHGAVWYYFLRTGIWQVPPSRIYTNLGQGSVLLFFMITGFLFWLKLLRGRSEPINWYKLYVSRLLRLLPLYGLALVLLGLTVVTVTGFHLQDSRHALAKNILSWSSFTVMGAPDLNGVEKTAIIVGGVTWTLGYEWMFYFALPLLAVSARVVTPRHFIIAGLAIVAWICYVMRPGLIFIAAFGGGMLAATLVHARIIPRFFEGPRGAVAAIVCAMCAFLFFRTAYAVAPLLLLSVAFAIIASGNNLFGVLTWPTSVFLGQLTYSIYLLHGLLLFWTFHFVIGFSQAASYSPATHWLIVCLCIPCLLILCYATYRWIELPGMRSVSHVGGWWRRISARRAVSGPTIDR